MNSTILDLDADDFRKALDIGLASLRHYVGEPVQGVPTADERYQEDHLACAEYVMGSSPAIVEIFKDTDPHIATQEKRMLALVFLAWPAIRDFTVDELAGYIGTVAANTAVEMSSNDRSGQISNLSTLADKGIRVEEEFLKIYFALRKTVTAVPEGLLEGLERELAAMNADKMIGLVPRENYISHLQQQAGAGVKLTSEELLYILMNTKVDLRPN